MDLVGLFGGAKPPKMADRKVIPWNPSMMLCLKFKEKISFKFKLFTSMFENLLDNGSKVNAKKSLLKMI